VGIALELYHQEIVANGGLAGRFDVLLRQWQTLETLNQQAMDRWDKRLNGEQETKLWDKLLQPKLSFKQGMTWGSIIAAVLLIMWLLLGRGYQVVNTTVYHNHYYGFSEEAHAKKANDLGVTDAALANFFKILEQNNVDRADLDKKLREIAEKYKKWSEDAKLLENSDDPKVKELLRQAREFREGKDAQGNAIPIDFSKADELLHQAFEEKYLKIKQLQETEEKTKAVREKEELDAARILKQRGDLKNTQLKYAEAADYYRRAAKLLPAGSEKDKGDYLNEAGLALRYAGKYQEAFPLYQNVLEIREKVLGKQHKDYAESLNNLAELYQEQGQYEKAFQLYQEALKIREQVLGKQHPDYAESLNNLALLHKEQGQYEQALPWYQKALDIFGQVLGKQHPYYITTLGNLGNLYSAQGEYEQALPLLKDTLKICEQVLGKQHPHYAISLNSLAELYRKQGKYKQARPLFEDMSKIHEQVLGKQHPYYATSLNNLAYLDFSQGEYEKALPLFQRAVKIHTKALGEKHPDSQLFAKNLRDTQEHLSGKYQVVVEQIVPGSSASLLGIQAGDIFTHYNFTHYNFTHYNQQPILGKSQFTEKFAKEFADTIGEFKLLRDGKMLTFQLKPSEIEVEVEEKLKYAP